MAVEIPLSSKRYPGLVAVVNEDDYTRYELWKYTWHPKKGAKTFYAATHTKVDGQDVSLRMHRLIRPDIAGQIDHANRNGLDNRRENLRLGTESEHKANRQGWGKSPYQGVSWHKCKGKWHARVQVNGKLHHLGYYVDPIEAARAYDIKAVELFGEFSVLNFPHATAN